MWGSRVAKREYSFEVVDQCEDLYIRKEKTFEQISHDTKVSTAQLLRWAKTYSWKTKKAEYRQRFIKAQEETRALMREEILLQDLVNQKNLLDTYFKEREYDKADSNTLSNYINIVTNISKLLQDIRKRDEALRAGQKIDRLPIFLEFVRDQITFLKDRHPDMVLSFETILDEYAFFAKEKYTKSV